GIRDFHVTGVQTCALPISPVDWAAPCAKFVVMPATCTPRPTCAGFEPPASCCGSIELRTSCDSESWNCTAEALKPVVFTLAMLRSEERRVGKEGRSGEAHG